MIFGKCVTEYTFTAKDYVIKTPASRLGGFRFSPSPVHVKFLVERVTQSLVFLVIFPCQ